MYATFQELVWQLHRLPGGARAAVPDFFGALLVGPPAHGTEPGRIECWPLAGGDTLCLEEGPGYGPRLVRRHAAGEERLAEFPAELLAAARETTEEPGRADTVSPLVLALLAIATGEVEDGGRLKRALPRVNGAARDLMLMTVCRLCG